ncbi:MAG: T9SS C-terminal target domain-containing protein [Cytophagia bacterium]|nr:MAG: T9SS C-terminal target domain-containing protein [Cytophagia bacterium]
MYNCNIFTFFYRLKSLGELKLKDLQGKVILTDKTNEEKYKLDLQNYPSGIYILHLNNGEKTAIHKIVKQ